VDQVARSTLMAASLSAEKRSMRHGLSAAPRRVGRQGRTPDACAADAAARSARRLDL
jgi:hypothetical protein